MLNEFNILFVTDKKDIANDFIKSINVARNKIDIAENEREAIVLFESKKPSVVLFFYSTVELSEDVYFGLYRNAKNIQKIPHRAIVLCDHVDIEKACEKCMHDIFFDYIVISPRLDRARINLSIYNALRFIEQEKGCSTNREFARLSKNVSAYSNDIRESIRQSSSLVADNERSFDELSNDIRSNMKSFSTNLANKNDSSASQLTSNEIINEVDNFSLNVLEKDIQRSKEKVSAVMKNYADRLAASQKKHEKSLSELNDLSMSVPKRVLIVEDNEVYGDMVSTVLNKEGGFEVILTSTVHQGMAYMLKYKPDVVLLDYELPDATAGEFLEKTRAISSLKHIPVIILTSHNTTDVYTTTVMLGAQDFLVKPATKNLILEKITKCLAQNKKAENQLI